MHIPQYTVYKGIIGVLSFICAIIFILQYRKSQQERHTHLLGIFAYFFAIMIAAFLFGGTSIHHADLKDLNKLAIDSTLACLLCFFMVFFPFEAFVFSRKDPWRLHIILLYSGLSLFYIVSIFGLSVVE